MCILQNLIIYNRQKQVNPTKYVFSKIVTQTMLLALEFTGENRRKLKG